MKNLVLSTVFTFGVVGGMALGNEPAEEEIAVSQTTALLGETAVDKKRVYIYSKEPLKGALTWKNNEWVEMKQFPRQGDLQVFSTGDLPAIAAGKKVNIYGLRKDGSYFEDVLTLAEGEEEGKLVVKVRRVKEVSAEENFKSKFPMVTVNEIYHGGSTLPPQTVAQARVVYMAYHGAGVHFGSAGSLQTNVGSLSEGWGNGFGTCTGNGPCYADAWVTGPHGSHHLRFYRGGTFSNGGGRGRRWR